MTRSQVGTLESVGILFGLVTNRERYDERFECLTYRCLGRFGKRCLCNCRQWHYSALQRGNLKRREERFHDLTLCDLGK